MESLILTLGIAFIIVSSIVSYISEQTNAVKKRNEAFAKVRQLEQQLQELTRSLKEKDKQIQTYAKQINELNNNLSKEKQRYNNSFLREENQGLEKEILKLNSKINYLLMEISQKNESLKEYENIFSMRSHSLEQILTSNLTAFPYLASIIADYMTYELDIMIQQLSWGNNIARQKKVTSLTKIKQETKRAIEQAKIAEYQLSYLKTLFPMVEDVIETDFRDLDMSIDVTDTDPIRKYMTKDEYYTLSESQRNQLALDRYIESHKKNKWQIGRDYELYVGYKYALTGWNVEYFGSFMGLEDLGRDLIAKRNNETLIIQCKYWSKNKTIHEKHIAQLYGTYICYCQENAVSSQDARAVFITSTALSDKAKEFCKYLNIGYKENFNIGNFPRIKCNIGVDEFGGKTKIYHLPMDQQYDKVKLDKKGECWAYTVEEAEQLGFRRAYKWHTNEN